MSRSLFLLLLCSVLLLPPLVVQAAQTHYVSNHLVLVLRDAPDENATIIGRLGSDDAVELLGKDGAYARVKTAKGAVGYVSFQYLTTEIPKSIQVAQLETRVRELEQQLTQSGEGEGGDAQESELSSLRVELQGVMQEKNDLQTRYDQLVGESQRLLDLIRERDQLKQKNQQLTDTTEKLREENQQMLTIGGIKWFLAGAGVLFFGWLLGKVSRRQKRGFHYVR